MVKVFSQIYAELIADFRRVVLSGIETNQRNSASSSAGLYEKPTSFECKPIARNRAKVIVQVILNWTA